MKRFALMFFILITLSLGVTAQTDGKTRKSGLPAAINKMNDADSGELLNNPVIKMRLKKLLGKRNYASFLESFESLNPVVKNRTILFSSGCLIHACGHAESAIAIHLASKTIHASIYRDGEKTRFFNENRRTTPLAIKKWANRLSSTK